MTIKQSEINLKDVIAGAFGLLIAIIGFFISQRLASIDSSINQFYEWQRTQIATVERMAGRIDQNNLKIDRIEKRVDVLEKKN